MQKSDDTSNIAKNVDLACLKSDIDNQTLTVGKSTKRFKQFKTKVNTLDLDKLVPILVD